MERPARLEITRETLLDMYRTMVTIRVFEERGLFEVTQRALSGSVHSSAGQEAVPTGICAHLTGDDYLASTHRGHGHCIAKGVDPKLMMAELFGKTSGTNRGKGGSMHIADMSQGMLGANGVVAASVPLAVGAGLSIKTRGEDRVAVAFFGDGGANQGATHESMNLASVWKLPVIFVCENNLYAESTPVEYALSVKNVADRGAAYSMPGVTVDGMDIFAVYDAAGQAVGRARSGQGPTLLECRTYRYYGHTVRDNPHTYRTEAEEQEWRARDPINSMKERVLQEGTLSELELSGIEAQVTQTMDQAIRFAEAGEDPDLSELYTDVYVDYPMEQLRRGAGMLA